MYMGFLSDKEQRPFNFYKEPCEKNNFQGFGVCKPFGDQLKKRLQKGGVIYWCCGDGHHFGERYDFLRSFLSRGQFHICTLNGGAGMPALTKENDEITRSHYLRELVGAVIVKAKDPHYPNVDFIIPENHLCCGVTNGELELDIYESHEAIANTTEWISGIFRRFARNPVKVEELILPMYPSGRVKEDTRQTIYEKIKWDKIEFIPFMHTSRLENDREVYRVYEMSMDLWALHHPDLHDLTADYLGKSHPRRKHRSNRFPMQPVCAA